MINRKETSLDLVINVAQGLSLLMLAEGGETAQTAMSCKSLSELEATLADSMKLVYLPIKLPKNASELILQLFKDAEQGDITMHILTAAFGYIFSRGYMTVCREENNPILDAYLKEARAKKERKDDGTHTPTNE